MKLVLLDSIQSNSVVKVNALRKLVKIEGDHLLYDPSLLPGANSDNAWELLRKLPGFWLDPESGIHISGSSQVTVYINGVKQALLASQIQYLLTGLPGSVLDKVEVTTGGSYKFDAASGTVVNIVLKKRDDRGLNIRFSNGLSLNKYLGDQHNLYLAIRTGKLAMNTSLSFDRNYRYFDQDGHILYGASGSGGAVPATVDYDGKGRSLNVTPSFMHNMSWDLSKNSSLALNLTVNRQVQKLKSMQRRVFKGVKNYENIFNSRMTRKEQLLSADLNYRLKLDSLGSDLVLGYGLLAGYLRSHKNFDNRNFPTNIQSSIEPETGPVYMRGLNDLNGHQHLFKLDGQQVFNKAWRIDYGGKLTLGSLNNQSHYDTIRGDLFIPDRSRSDSTVYTEKLAAVYLGTTYQLAKFGFTAGLRLEHTWVGVNSVAQSYTNIQPNLAINFKYKHISSLLKLTTTLSRPAYGYLNSGRLYINDYSYLEGNADLRPSKQYRFSLENSLFDFADLSMGYIRINDQITRVGHIIGKGPFVVLRPENAVNVNDYYINLTLYYRLLKDRWDGHVSAYGEMYDYRLPTGLDAANIAGRQRYGTLSVVNRYTLTGKLKFETNAFFRSTANFYQIRQRHRWQLDLGLDYELNDHWNIAAKYYDLFSTYQYDYAKFYTGYVDQYRYDPHVNKLKLSIVFKLSKNGKKIKELTSGIDPADKARFSGP